MAEIDRTRTPERPPNAVRQLLIQSRTDNRRAGRRGQREDVLFPHSTDGKNAGIGLHFAHELVPSRGLLPTYVVDDKANGTFAVSFQKSCELNQPCDVGR